MVHGPEREIQQASWRFPQLDRSPNGNACDYASDLVVERAPRYQQSSSRPRGTSPTTCSACSASSGGGRRRPGTSRPACPAAGATRRVGRLASRRRGRQRHATRLTATPRRGGRPDGRGPASRPQHRGREAMRCCAALRACQIIRVASRGAGRVAGR